MMVNESSENLSRVNRVYKCISRILSIQLDKAKASYPTKSDDFKRFQEICSFMAQKQPDGRTYPRWLTQLLIEVPYENLLIESLDQWKISKAANFNAGIPAKELPDLIDAQQKMRLILAEKLYNCLPEREKKDFGDLLSYGKLDLTNKIHIDTEKLGDPWTLHDIRCAELIYALEYSFDNIYHKIEEIILRTDIVYTKADLAKKVFESLYINLQSVAEETLKSNDSLFAKLLLNMATNRAILEIDYQQHFANIAKESSVKLIRFLQKQIDVLPIVNSQEEIIPHLEKIFNTDHPDIKRKINTNQKKESIMKRSTDIFSCYLRDNSGGRKEFIQAHRHTQNQFLMALCVAWSYVTKAEIILHQEGLKHRKIEIINSRKKDEGSGSYLLPEIRRYHYNQYGLFFYSGQWQNLSELELEGYAENQAVYRAEKRGISAHILKKMTLSGIRRLFELDYSQISITINNLASLEFTLSFR